MQKNKNKNNHKIIVFTSTTINVFFSFCFYTALFNKKLLCHGSRTLLWTLLLLSSIPKVFASNSNEDKFTFFEKNVRRIMLCTFIIVSEA